MVAPISSLSNMEMQLYGGRNYNATAPSYINGYQASSAMMNTAQMPLFGGYNTYPNYYGIQNYNSPAFEQSLPVNYGTVAKQTGNAIQAQQGRTAQALTKKEAEAFVDYYAKGLTPSESLFAAGASCHY